MAARSVCVKLCTLSRHKNRLLLPAFSVSLCQKGYATDNVPSSLVGRDFLTLRNYSKNDIETLLWTAKDLKTRIRDKKEIFQPLVGKTISLIFQKRSTRTRLSSEIGMSLLGGKAAFLSPDDVHLGVNESLSDTAKVLSGFNDLVLARVFAHSDLEVLAAEGSIPVISGLSDLYHPLQALADLLTLQEHFGRLKGLNVAWVGDGNNIIHSLMMGGLPLGINFRVATPAGYDCDSNVKRDAHNAKHQSGVDLLFTNDPREAVQGADVVVTDTWVSMGQEEEKKKRLNDFKGYQVDRKMTSVAAPGWVFLHCLPRKQEEVTDDIFYAKNSLVWQEAENRMWTVMAVMLHLLQDHTPTILKPKL